MSKNRPIKRTRYMQVESMPTRDGSIIRELMHPSMHDNRNQSFAEATIEPGQITALHKHLLSEEIYHIVSGNGVMRLGEDILEVDVGDTICIAPGTVHSIHNQSDDDMKIFCCCSPAYQDEDTVLVEELLSK